MIALLLGCLIATSLPHSVLGDQTAAITTERSVQAAAECRDGDVDNWPMPRGDVGSSGSTTSQIPDAAPEVLWTYENDEGFESTPVIDQGILVASDMMGTLIALDAKTGKKRWDAKTPLGFAASPAIRESTVYIGDLDGVLYAFDLKDGTAKWQYETEGEINGAPAFYKDRVLVASQDGKLYCLNAADGKSVWVYESKDQIRCSPSVVGNRTFLGGCDAALHSVDLETGTQTAAPIPLNGPTGSTPAVVGDIAYLPTMEGAVYAIDWRQHKVRWQWEDDKRPQQYRNSAAANTDMIVVSSKRKFVDALSPAGKPIWRYTLRREADASPLISGNDVWIASIDGRLIRLDATSGKEKWSMEIKGGFAASPAIASQRLFIADDRGIIRCLGTP